LERPWQVTHLLTESGDQRRGQHERVGQHVVDPVRAGGARIGQPVHLHRGRAHRQHLRGTAAAPAAQVEQHVDGGVPDARGDLRVRQRAHLVHLRGGRLQACPQGAAIAGGQREQVQVQAAGGGQLFQQRHDQQPGGMRAEAVGQKAHAQAALAAHGGGGQRPHAGADDRGALPRTGQLFGGTAVFAQERKRLHCGLALRDGLAHLCRQALDVAPVAQPTLPVEQLRGDVGFARQ